MKKYDDFVIILFVGFLGYLIGPSLGVALNINFTNFQWGLIGAFIGFLVTALRRG